METLDIHAKSFLVKWVNAPDNHVIEWQVKPVKKTINFGIYRFKGNAVGDPDAMPTFDSVVRQNSTRKRSHSLSHNHSALEKLEAAGLEQVTYQEKCLPNELVKGVFTVGKGQGGTFAIVFDNTFSRTTPKTVLFSQHVVSASETQQSVSLRSLKDKKDEHTGPQEIHSSGNKSISINELAPLMSKVKLEDAGTSHDDYDTETILLNGDSSATMFKRDSTIKGLIDAKGGNYFSGILSKKRRKKHQGYAKRFFTLNLKYGVLTYYLNEKSQRLRGSMPVGLSVISAKKKGWEIIIDSGMEIWYLKALSEEEWLIWLKLLQFARLNPTENAVGHVNDTSGEGVDSLIALAFSKPSSKLDILNDELKAFQSTLTQTNRGVYLTKQLISSLQIESSVSLLKPLNHIHAGSETPHSTNRGIGSVGASDSDLCSKKAAPPMGHSMSSDSSKMYQQTGQSSSTISSKKSGFWRKRKSNSGAATPEGSQIFHEDGSFASQQKIQSRSNCNTMRQDDTFVLPKSTGMDVDSQNASPEFAGQVMHLSIARELLDVLINLQAGITTIVEAKKADVEQEKSQSEGSRTAEGVEMGELASPRSEVTSVSDHGFVDAQEYFSDTEKMDEMGVVMLSDGEDDDNEFVSDFEDEEDEDEDQIMKPPAVRTAAPKNLNRDRLAKEETIATEGALKSSKAFERLESMGYSTPSLASQEEDEETNLFPLTEMMTNNITLQPRTEGPKSSCAPPSIMSLVRKNVGKDLSSVSMPVTANEPLSMLQKYAEMFEYANLLDRAAESKKDTGERILRIAAFAVSYISSARVKERCIRKPFNPLLGETFEYISPEGEFRLVAEKVSHHPVVLAYLVESKNWSVSFSPCPSQKFWGKSAEINVAGKVTIRLTKLHEEYSYNLPTTFLRNMVAGEKYIEPVGVINIVSSTGQKAVVRFKVGGMFSGRSEQLQITALDAHGNPLPCSVQGSWTEKLVMKGVDSLEREIWTAGKLVPNAAKHFGFTTFAASLNEISPKAVFDLPKLCPHDSRLRPDQRLYENGDVEKAETLKKEIEEKQRSRRKQLEAQNKEWKPNFFELSANPSEEGETWIYRGGEKSYWERRKTGNWDDLVDLW